MSKNSEHLDPRVVRTRKMLLDALIALIKERGFEAVKPQEIAERATLNRATFYLHYRDKDDLLIKSMHDILGKLMESTSVPETSSRQLSAEDISKQAVAVFDHFAQYADFYRVMLCEAGVPSIIAEVQRCIEEIGLRWLRWWQPDPIRCTVEPEMVIKFAGTACIGVAKWWLENNRPYSTEEIARQFVNLVLMGVCRPLGVDLPAITA